MAITQSTPEAMYIDGKWIEGASGKRIPVYDPSTEEVIAEIPDASNSEIDSAISRRASGFRRRRLAADYGAGARAHPLPHRRKTPRRDAATRRA